MCGWQTVAGCKAVGREVGQICRCYTKVLNLCVIHPQVYSLFVKAAKELIVTSPKYNNCKTAH